MLSEAVRLQGKYYSVLISNHSSTTSSETIVHDARILDCIAVHSLVSFIISEIHFRTNTPTITHQ